MSITFIYRLYVHEQWIAFGVGKKYRYISVHDIALHLGERKSESLAGFHTFTDYDLTSIFSGKGKKIGFSIYNCFEDSFETFRQIASTIFQEEVVVF